MPKMKSHKASHKRFRKTGRGKIVRRGGNRLHKSEHRPTRVMKRRQTDLEVSSADQDRVKRLLES